ncbi:MAG TPA: Rieske 2Fe-2S domain-containing protein, partial [Myxococcota bacterium]|nr:Rieske 2Fe-2S domain-containing protein [Myxococcota bacterium]
MNEARNAATQPFHLQPAFANPAVVLRGWYAVCRSEDLPAGRALGVDVARQHLAVWRGASGAVHATDGFCRHMGTDLAIGSVVGEHLRCFFHHWTFDGSGRCVRIPVTDAPPDRAHTHGWATSERYGLVWVFPDATAPWPLPEFPGAEGEPVVWRHGRPILRTCHHHVCMINGMDVQHLETVHGMRLDLDARLDEDGALFDVVLAGAPHRGTRRGRAAHALLGGFYSYSMRYQAGTVGLLTTVRDTRLLGRYRLPEIRMLFAYRPLPDGGTWIQPTFIAPAGGSARSRAAAQARLAAMA